MCTRVTCVCARVTCAFNTLTHTSLSLSLHLLSFCSARAHTHISVSLHLLSFCSARVHTSLSLSLSLSLCVCSVSVQRAHTHLSLHLLSFCSVRSREEQSLIQLNRYYVVACFSNFTCKYSQNHSTAIVIILWVFYLINGSIIRIFV